MNSKHNLQPIKIDDNTRLLTRNIARDRYNNHPAAIDVPIANRNVISDNAKPASVTQGPIDPRSFAGVGGFNATL